MNEFSATHFRFEVEALTTIAFDDYTGSALRGGLVTALQRNFCPARDQADAAHQAICPVCWLLSHEATPGDSRRPYAVEPLLGERRYFAPGERFQFGLTLFGQAVNLFPYLVLAVPRMGSDGVGRKTPSPPAPLPRGEGRAPSPPAPLPQGEGRAPSPPAPLPRGEGRAPSPPAPLPRGEGRAPSPPAPLPQGEGGWRRGRFVLRAIEEVNPLTGVRRTLMGEGQQMVQTPQHAVTSAQVQAAAEGAAQRLQANGGQLSLRFLTPTRIVHEKKLVHEPHFRPLFQRLLERVNELQRTFGQASEPPPWQGLLALADQVQLLRNQAPWWDVQGRSSRLEREQQLGGFIGDADYGAPPDLWPSLLPWLIWGMSTHVGKNAVKGSGWYGLKVSGER